MESTLSPEERQRRVHTICAHVRRNFMQYGKRQHNKLRDLTKSNFQEAIYPDNIF